MKIELERMLELIKTVLLVVIVIFLCLNFYNGGAESKYEIYSNGMFLLNKDTGETYQPKEINGTVEYVKIKIKE
ncbi:hypothetical protein [Flavobacterium sp.]|uniref:hypothetical protein n=1 Tax=Flavobacterium sp. TaxID=239 RepID=UPI0022C11830|nr:hypothetical protein [Flavobacterium sp.]MCZ8229445.1 hypothetical protein [Flavobacterium sp.]